MFHEFLGFFLILTLRGYTVLQFEKMQAVCCTGLLRSSNLVYLESKNSAYFTGNLVQNLMNLVLNSKSDRKWPKNS